MAQRITLPGSKHSHEVSAWETNTYQSEIYALSGDTKEAEEGKAVPAQRELPQQG